ncbi:hypothetical protein FQN60_012442 [Etheostoma spectabile]|uniref:Uncharacterized protein n=1 Tax=Etheostoma spectabile TaxID=54343 RepID=A0A5J5DPD6_9PERO|nr:hypothetical protein FQN60_012442 [Etheostoma spectabile]
MTDVHSEGLFRLKLTTALVHMLLSSGLHGGVERIRLALREVHSAVGETGGGAEMLIKGRRFKYQMYFVLSARGQLVVQLSVTLWPSVTTAEGVHFTLRPKRSQDRWELASSSSELQGGEFRSLTRLARSFIEVVVVASSPEGCFWAPGNRERQPGSCIGLLPRPGAYAADLRGDESCGIPPPRRLPLPVTYRR